MKKTYLQPTMNVVKIQHSQMLCGSITDVEGGDTSIGYGGSSTQSARVKSNTVDWDDDWSE